jgi:hypothetical protein
MAGRRSGTWLLAGALVAFMSGIGAAAAGEPIVELRQYTLYPGKRDLLIALFEANFVESQEALGMHIIGTFREPEHPSHFVWLRGFANMNARAKGLEGFYSGPVWQAHRGEANPMLEDNDNVLLLHEAWPGAGFPSAPAPRAPVGAAHLPGGLIVASIYYLKAPPETGFTATFKTEIAPALAHAGLFPLAAFVREESPNNFPKLKIREGENVFVWFAKFASAGDYDRALARLAKTREWNAASRALDDALASPPEVLKLEPTARSELHG